MSVNINFFHKHIFTFFSPQFWSLKWVCYSTVSETHIHCCSDISCYLSNQHTCWYRYICDKLNWPIHWSKWLNSLWVLLNLTQVVWEHHAQGKYWDGEKQELPHFVLLLHTIRHVSSRPNCTPKSLISKGGTQSMLVRCYQPSDKEMNSPVHLNPLKDPWGPQELKQTSVVTHMCAGTLWWWWHRWGSRSTGHSGYMGRTGWGGAWAGERKQISQCLQI